MKVEIKLGTKLSELKLGQLVGIADYIDLVEKERTDEENQKMIQAIDFIFDLSPAQIAQLTGEHLDAMTVMVFNSFKSLCYEYGQMLKEPKHYPAFTLIAKTKIDIDLDKIEIEQLREERKGKYFGKRKKLTKTINDLISSHTPQLFRIKEDITKEPMGLWVAKLDNVDKVIQSIPPEKFYHQWQFIPVIVSMIAWRDNEERTKVIGGKLTVNNARIDYVSQAMLHLNAKVAVQIFAFFFSTKNPSFHDQFLRQCLKELTTLTQEQVSKEKNTENSGDGLVTS